MASHSNSQICNKSIEGLYINYSKVGHNADVFVIDCFQIFPDNSEEKSNDQLLKNPRIRIVTSPADVRQLYENLKVSIKAYEKRYGTIKKDNNKESPPSS